MFRKTKLILLTNLISLYALAQSPPVLDPIGDKTVSDGSILFFKATSTDAEGDPLSYSLSGLGVQPRMMLDSYNGLFIWVPEAGDIGTHEVTVEVSDGGLTDSETITITVTSAIAEGVVVYVDENASGANSGLSWANAFTDLNSAISAASNGDQIWVAAGTYTPDLPGGNKNKSFLFTKELAFYGGFIGGETSREGRDGYANKTILSGDLNRDDNTVGTDENSATIFRPSASNLLDGFHITAGNGSSASAYRSFTGDIWALMRNCVITGNNSEGSGASNILSFGGSTGPSSLTVENCLFADNTSTGELIGLSGPFSGNRAMQAIFINSTFTRNNQIIDSQRESIVGSFINCVFDDNEDNYTRTLFGASYEFQNCIFPDDPNYHSNSNIILFENNQINQTVELTPIYSLAQGNAGIDNGRNDYVDGTLNGVVDKDLSGMNRITGGTVDMGAFEFIPDPTNNPPVVSNPIEDQSNDEDQLFDFIFPVDAFNDLDGDELKYGARLSNGDRLPDWLSFDGDTRRFLGTPQTDDDALSYTVKVTASDLIANVSDEFELVINAINDEPVVDPIGDKTFNAGKESSFNVVATDEESNTENLTYSLDPTSLIKGMEIDNDGRFSWSPENSQIGDHTVTISVADDHISPAESSETITITVIMNSAPQFEEIGDPEVIIGSILYLDVDATDEDDDQLEFELKEAPAGMDLYPEYGIVSWIPHPDQAGVHNITIEVTDGIDTESKNFSVIVNNLDLASDVIFVDHEATGGNNGSSWNDAYTDLKIALHNVVNGQQLWVAEGIYTPSQVLDRNESFIIDQRVVLYGGFNGTESSLNERSPNDNKTVLSGDLADNDDSEDNNENSYNIVKLSTNHTGMAIDGVTITGGHGYQTGSNSSGVAIKSINRDVVFYIRNTIIENNAANFYGVSSIVNFGSNDPNKLIITNSVFRENTSTGAVILISGSSSAAVNSQAEIYNSNFIGNQANIMDLQDDATNMKFFNSLIIKNEDDYMRALFGSQNEFYNCAFDGDPTTMPSNGITVFQNNLINQSIDMTEQFEIAWDSPLRNTGSIGYINPLGSASRDLSGNIRVNEISVEIGAYEFTNFRPSLNTSFEVSLPAIDEDNINNPGQSVSDILASNGGIFNDPNYQERSGIAVIVVDNTHGSWEYSVDAGSNWSTISIEGSDQALLLSDRSGAKVRFVPNQDYSGTIENGLAFKAWDQYIGLEGTLENVSGTSFGNENESIGITVNPVNDAPQLSVDDMEAEVGTTLEVQLTAIDIDSEALSYSLDNSSKDKGIGIDSSTGLLQWTPSDQHSGPHTLVVSVSDGEFTTENEFIITVVEFNNPPVVNEPITDATVLVGESFTRVFHNTFSDIEDDQLTLAVTLENGEPIPAWLSFDQGTYTLTGTPSRNDISTITVKVTGVDGKGKEASTTFRISVMESVTSISDPLEVQWHIYPNPTSDYLNISSNDIGDTRYDIRLYKMNGTLARQARIENLNGAYQLNLQQQNSGIYLLVINTHYGEHQERIIIE